MIESVAKFEKFLNLEAHTFKSCVALQLEYPFRKIFLLGGFQTDTVFALIF